MFAQPEMGSVVMIIRDVLGQEPPEMALVQRDDMIEQIAAATANPALGDTVLPGVWMEVWRQVMLMERIAAGTSNPYLAS